MVTPQLISHKAYFSFSLSTSTMSVSSSSSRGSYGSHGSLSASSRGSLNSLVHHPSHPDSYQQSPGNQEHYTQYHLPSTSCPPIYEAHILATKENAEAVVVSSNVNGFSSPYLSTSGTSLASRDSTPTSYTSPVSLYNNSYYSASGESPLQHQGRVQQTYAEVTTYEETSALERFQPQVRFCEIVGLSWVTFKEEESSTHYISIASSNLQSPLTSCPP